MAELENISAIFTSDTLIDRIASLTQRAKRLEAQIEQAKLDRAKLQGQQALLDEKLKSEFGLDSWEQAPSWLSKLKKQAENAVGKAEKAFEDAQI